MTIEILPFTPDLTDAVARFNGRMHDTGWGWYESPTPAWMPKGAGRRAWREYWLAVEDRTEVRGAFALKPQEWRVRERVAIVTDWQGPVSEGLIDRRYGLLALRLLREMLRQRPLLYSWGHGGRDTALMQLLRAMPGWLFHWTPLHVRALRPFRVLRHNGLLRRTRGRCLALDALAFSGLGPTTIHALQALAACGVPRLLRRRARVTGEPFERFGGWADELWERAKDRYSIVAVRDSEAMNVIAARDAWPRAMKLRVRRGADTIGWAILFDTQMRGDRRFGDLRVGSVVDCFAAPEDAADVVGAALDHLAERGVDVVVSNQAHPEWSRAFTTNGSLAVPRGRAFAASPGLVAAMEPFEHNRAGLHMTNMDGHGPLCL